MPEIFMIRDGQSLLPADQAALELIKTITEGRPTPVKVSKKRSNPHLRLFFAAIKTAFENWPENHCEQFENAEELRGWLLCKAGHHTNIKLDLDSEKYAANCARLMTFFIIHAYGHRTIFFKSHKTKLIAYVPQSISYEKLNQGEFNKISQEISDVLKAEIQMSLDDFKQQEAA